MKKLLFSILLFPVLSYGAINIEDRNASDVVGASSVNVVNAVLSGNGTASSPLDVNRTSVTVLGARVDLNSANEVT